MTEILWTAELPGGGQVRRSGARRRSAAPEAGCSGAGNIRRSSGAGEQPARRTRQTRQPAPRAAAPRSAAPRRKRTRRGGRGLLPVAALLLAGLLLWIWQSGAAFRLLPRPPYRVAVDAGHGGGDPGAVGLAEEAQLTRQTLLALEQLLEEDPNFTPLACRDLDQPAAAGARGREAARQGADLLLSIHANSDPDGTASGFECYPLLPQTPDHRDSLRFAGLLAEEMAAAGAPLRGEGGIRYACYDAEGAKTIYEQSQTPPDGAQTFGVLEQAGCPAVLAEQCFVTSAEDLARFGGEEGCRRAAEAYYRAICRYFGTQPLDTL